MRCTPVMDCATILDRRLGRVENSLSDILCLTWCAFCVAVVLLDTTTEASLDWTRYPYGPQAQTPGVSITHFRFASPLMTAGAALIARGLCDFYRASPSVTRDPRHFCCFQFSREFIPPRLIWPHKLLATVQRFRSP